MKDLYIDGIWSGPSAEQPDSTRTVLNPYDAGELTTVAEAGEKWVEENQDVVRTWLGQE
ncbi:hypothetical protein SAMN06265360_108156 [Haloechinothrix alba]|uniref:Aldehyde dehydrogenase family protein n=1 Tax=Haloechinothrix alba TaxID=664784 RepID=A0A238X179_9PSEU|nr:hypothetical protein [Haloechinothrix alba]SNR52358.1 hypothetical protein SAMN06265360_108156 [Haloechinothrix alba]